MTRDQPSLRLPRAAAPPWTAVATGAMLLLCKRVVDHLTSTEIMQLSRLCTAFSLPASSNGNSSNTGFGAVDGDLLASLFPLLEAHVVSAAQVDLIGEVCQALGPGSNNDGDGEHATMTINQVR